MDIIDYELEEFLRQPQELIEEYMTYMKYLKATPTELEVFHMSLKDVEYIKQNLSQDITEVICKVQRLPLKLVLKMPITRFFALFNSVKNQVEIISKAEQRGLSGDGDPRFEAVGGAEIMGKYGIYNTILPLCEQFGWTIRQIEEMPYSEIFSILLYNKDRTKVQEKMNKIKI